MVELNVQMQVQNNLNGAQELSPEQKALSQAQSGLAANNTLKPETKQVISTILASYASFGVDVSKYSDLSFECLARINENQHETIMTMLEDWAIFLQQQAKLDKEAAQRSQEAAKEIAQYISSQDGVKITNSRGEIVKDRRVIKRMSPEQKRMLTLAKTYSNIVGELHAAAMPAVSSITSSAVTGVERSTMDVNGMVTNRVCIAPPKNDIGVSTQQSGNKVH